MNLVTEQLLRYYRYGSAIQKFQFPSNTTIWHRGIPMTGHISFSINVSLKWVLNGCKRQKNRFLYNSVVHNRSLVCRTWQHITDSLPGHAEDIRKIVAPYLALCKESSKNTRYVTCWSRLTLKVGWTDWWRNKGHIDGIHMWQRAYAGVTIRQGLAISLTL